MYHCLSEAEHRMNYGRRQIDLAHGEVDTQTHVIMHLKNVMET
jgi:hypothetical protein